MNLCQMMMQSAAQGPRRPALVWEGRELSYAKLHEEMKKTTALLQAAGVKKGDRVGLQVPKSLETIYLHLACLALGAVALPLNDGYQPVEVAYCLADSGAGHFFTSAELYERSRSELDGLGGLKIFSMDEPVDGAEFYPDALARVGQAPEPDYPTEAGDAGLICYTSGTTGKPKGAVITHRALVENLQDLTKIWRMSPGDVVLNTLPLFHVHGLMVCLYLSLLNRAKVILHKKFNPSQVWQAIGSEGVTVFMGVPTLYQRLVDAWQEMPQKPDASGMRVFISGSAPLPDGLFQQFQEALGQAIMERYGMTETIMISSNPYEEDRRKAGSVGYPLPRVKLTVRDENGAELPPGQVGEVCVQGGNLLREYWGQPEKTSQSYFGEWFRTGDLGRQDPEDEMRLYLVGRAKELIISGGYNVYPKEVERRLEEHAAVKESAVFGLADRDLGERVTAAVVPAAGPSASQEELIAFCRQNLAGYKCPKRIHFMDELPRNSMGKVMKPSLQTICGEME